MATRSPESIKILFVEEDQGKRDVVMDHLTRSWDCRVTMAGSIAEGVEQLKSAQFDVVVADLGRREDGLELLKSIRSFHPEIPFYGLTACHDRDMMMMALEHGAECCLHRSDSMESTLDDLMMRLIPKVRQIRYIRSLEVTNEMLTRQTNTLGTLNQIILEASQAKDLDQILRKVLSSTVRLLDFDGGGIYFVDHDKGTASIVHSIGLDDDFLESTRVASVHEQPYKILFIDKLPIITERFDLLRPEIASRYGILSIASIPILADGEVIGSLNVASKRRRVISNKERATLLSIGMELGEGIERVRSNKELEHALDNLETLFDSINEMIFILDMDGNIIRTNKAVENQLQYPPEELLGQNVLSVHPPERREEAQAIVGAMIAGTADSCHVPVVRKDGMHLEVETKVTTGNWDGKPVLIGVTRDISLRRRTERMLADNERKYRLLAENSNDVIWKLDLATQRFTYISPSIKNLRGLSVEEAMGERLEDSISPEDYERVLQIMQDHVSRLSARDEKVASHTAIFRQRHKNGSWVTVEVVTTLIRDENGNITEVLGVSRDATIRHQAEAELKQKTEELEQFFGLTLDLLCIASSDGRFIRLNKAWETTLGYPLSVLEGAPLLDFVHPDDVGPTLAAMDRLRSQQDVLNFVNRYRCKDGSYRWIEWRSTPQGDTIYAAARDITERIRIEEVLKRSEEKLTQALEGSEAGLWDWMVQTGEVDFNEQWAKMLGYTLEELSPRNIKTWERLCHPEYLKLSNAMLKDVFEHRTDRYEVEVRMKHKDGRWIWILDRGRVWAWDDEGRPVRMSGTHIDISERKRTEETLLRINQKLNLLSSITRHDILNQIMVLSGNLDLMRHGEHGKESATFMDKMERSITNIQRQIEFTRDYQNMGLESPKWFMLSNIVHDGFDSLHPIGVKLDDLTQGYEIFVDPLAEKIFYNLVDNSIRHGGGIHHISVSCNVLDGRLHVVYMDDGCGIADKDRKGLFEKGFGKNTGLGLFLSKEILSITSIDISEQGQPGKGARFVLDVPPGAWRKK